ncbi:MULTISPECIES: hypothetical protein [Parafrankia]|uniref:hypothetical protein n=1 Tax=Parafrankia TaxID=2994362 RepID=UPI001041E785|nr:MULTISPECIES: hypothetical protein [Parafrankia]MBE3200200.1 hypothetical protein [Parafrankia sp. CH37]
MTEVVRPTLLTAGKLVEVVWNIPDGQTRPAGYRVSLYVSGCAGADCQPASSDKPASRQIAVQDVCATCSWATFDEPSVKDGGEYWASVIPLGRGETTSDNSSSLPRGRSSTEAVRVSTSPGATPFSAADLALDRAVEAAVDVIPGENDPNDAGIWIDVATGKVVHGFVDNSSYEQQVAKVQKINQAGLITTRRVKYSKSALTAIKDRIVRERADLAGVGIQINAVTLALKENKVRIRASAATPEAAAVLADRYGGDVIILDDVKIRMSSTANNPENTPAPRDPDPENLSWYGGIYIADGWLSGCTGGYLAQKSNGDYYMLTAGHCFDPTNIWGEPTLIEDDNGNTIGAIEDSYDGHDDDVDVASIWIPARGLATNQIIAESGSVFRNVTDDADEFVEDTLVCFSGVTSGTEKCARNYEQGEVIWPDGTIFYNATRAMQWDENTEDFALDGDSGSAIYRDVNDIFDDEFRVYGIESGTTWNEDDDENVVGGGFVYTFNTDIENAIDAHALESEPIP